MTYTVASRTTRCRVKCSFRRLLPSGRFQRRKPQRLKAESLKELNDALSQVKLAAAEKAKAHEFAGSTAIFQPPYSHAPITTAITKETLDTIAKSLTTVPEDFRVLPKIKRILLERRLQIWKAGGPYNWAFARGSCLRLSASRGHARAAFGSG